MFKHTHLTAGTKNSIVERIKIHAMIQNRKWLAGCLTLLLAVSVIFTALFIMPAGSMEKLLIG